VDVEGQAVEVPTEMVSAEVVAHDQDLVFGLNERTQRLRESVQFDVTR
jgi:hypothetical protein